MSEEDLHTSPGPERFILLRFNDEGGTVASDLTDHSEILAVLEELVDEFFAGNVEGANV